MPRLRGAVAASVLFLPLLGIAVVAQDPLLEDFEDDTVGQNPSEDFWTYAENTGSPGVSSDTAASGAKSLKVTADSWIYYRPPAPFDFCADDFEFNFRAPATAPASGDRLVLGGFMTEASLNTGSSMRPGGAGTSAGGSAYMALYMDGSLNVLMELSTTQSGLQGGLLFTATANTWYTIELFGANCVASAAAAFTARASGGDLGAPTETTMTCTGSCGTGTMADLNSFVAGRQGTNTGTPQFFVDNLGSASLVQPERPLPPAGLSAVVVEADTTTDPGDSGTVELRWPVSSDDPDQEQGSYAYEVYADGVDTGDDSTTGFDGDGLRFHSIEFIGNAPGKIFAFNIKARNTTSGIQSEFSCTVNVDTSVLGDSDSCGSGAPLGGTSIDFTTPTDTGAGLAGFCSDLMGDSAASLFLCGLILAIITFLGLGGAFAAMAGAPGLPAVIAGALGAFGVMLFNVQAQIWSLGAAAILILLATGVALGLTRRLFMGRASGGD